MKRHKQVAFFVNDGHELVGPQYSNLLVHLINMPSGQLQAVFPSGCVFNPNRKGEHGFIVFSSLDFHIRGTFYDSTLA